MRLPRVSIKAEALSIAYSRLFTSVVVAILQHQRDAEYVRHFVYRQIGPNLWTTLVLHSNVDLAALLCRACWWGRPFSYRFVLPLDVPYNHPLQLIGPH